MHRVGVVAAVVYFLGCGCTHGVSSRALPPNLGWLIGVWRTEGEMRYTVESWRRSDDGRLHAISETFRGQQRVFRESLAIEDRSGQLYLVASPDGQATHAFRLQRSGANSVCFQDLEHDYPQRICYSRPARDRLIAEISGKQGGKERTGTWRYRWVEPVTVRSSD